MKKLKSNAREWIFENLLRLIFKFSNSHRLVKFVKRPKDDSIYYEIQFKSKVEKTELLEAFENYLTNLTNKNVTSESAKRRTETFSVRNGYQTEEEKIEKLKSLISSSHEGKVLNLEESYLNQTYKDLQSIWMTKEMIEEPKSLMQEYIDLQVRTLKRSINKNGYEIISEVKNGFIIARKDRHNENPAKNDKTVLDKNGLEPDTSGEPIITVPINDETSGYVQTLRERLEIAGKLVREQLSIPDLSKQNFTKDFGISESEMNEYLEKDMEKYESEKNLSEKDLYKHIEESEEYEKDIKNLEEENSTDEPTWRDFANENKLFRFLDEDPDKYMERVKSAMRSKFTKSSLHPMSGVIDTIVESSKVAKSINELAKTFDKKSTVTEFKENPFYRSRANNAEF